MNFLYRYILYIKTWVEVNLFISASCKVTNPFCLSVTFTILLGTEVSNNEMSELATNSNLYREEIILTSTTQSPIKISNEPPYPCTTRWKRSHKVFFFYQFVPQPSIKLCTLSQRVHENIGLRGFGN